MSISSLVVHTRPENIDQVQNALNAMDGVEVQGINPEGKLVVVIDHPDRKVASQAIMDMQNIAGVINASLVYDYVE